MLPITPKSPSDLLKEFDDKGFVRTEQGGFMMDGGHIGSASQNAWLNEAFASLIVYTAERFRPTIDDVNDSMAFTAGLESLQRNVGAALYHTAMVEFAESLRQKDV